MSATLTTTFRLTTPFTHVERSYECAAWSETHTVQPGEYTAVFHPAQGKWTVSMPAKVTDDFFPALWGGVAVSSKPYQPKHIGEDRVVTLSFPADQFVHDARFTLTAASYLHLYKAAREVLARDFERFQQWVQQESDVSMDVEDKDPCGRWSTYRTALKFLTGTIARIDMLRTFREWHGNYFNRPGYDRYTWEHYRDQPTSN